jgi:preprotein translocase subunit SecB
MAEPDKEKNIFFNVEKIYIKDISYEAPGVPLAFAHPENSTGEIGVQLGLEHAVLDPKQGLYEVILTVTATAKRETKNIFLVEIKQAGVFRITGVEGEMLARVLEISCGYVLLPFVREAINDLVGKGGFPQLLINPINFEMVYEQKLTAREKQTGIN